MALSDSSGDVVERMRYDAFGGITWLDTDCSVKSESGYEWNRTFTGQVLDAETGLMLYRMRYYSPQLGRFVNRDPIEYWAGDVNLYRYVTNASIMYFDSWGLETYVVNGKIPDIYAPYIQEDYIYNSKEKKTISDLAAWNKWRFAPTYGAIFVGTDAARFYANYREGRGMPMTFDYERAYKQDSVIRTFIDSELEIAKSEAERIVANGSQKTFKMVRKEIRWLGENPETENWQKTIGDHVIYGMADVTYKDDIITMRIKIRAHDRYNFNKGDSDIATGIADEINGRFAVIGWARGFNSDGYLERTIIWHNPTMPSSPPTVISPTQDNRCRR